MQPLLEAQGVELVDLEYARPRRGRSTLRLFLDQPGGITLEVLTRISRVVGELLEVHDADSRVLPPGGLFPGADPGA